MEEKANSMKLREKSKEKKRTQKFVRPTLMACSNIKMLSKHLNQPAGRNVPVLLFALFARMRVLPCETRELRQIAKAIVISHD